MLNILVLQYLTAYLWDTFIFLCTKYAMYRWLIQYLILFKAQTKVRKKVMGVLDIYGFEIFEVRPL